MEIEKEIIEQENISDSDVVDPKLFNEVVVFGTDWTTETIDLQITKGNISLNPGFQRRIAWLDDRKSQFIESLIFGVPVPQILLAQNQSGKYIVLDGKQRLTAITEFFTGKFSLTGIKLDERLNGVSFEKLRTDFEEYYLHLTNRPIRTTVIRNCKHDSILHQIFLRVNTGSVPLSPQELRQALHPGEYVKFANEFTAQSKLLMAMLNLAEPDYRMRDVDIFVRSLAIFYFNSDYTGSMGVFLDSSCSKLNKKWNSDEAKIRDQAKEFENAISFTQECFGEQNAFRIWSGSSYNRIINRAVVDIMIYYFMNPQIRKSLNNKKGEIQELFKKVSQEKDFLKAVSFSTNSSVSMRTRFNLWGQALKTLDQNLPVNIPFSHL